MAGRCCSPRRRMIWWRAVWAAGWALAIELAAARTRLLDPAGLLSRLTASLDSLGTGAVDLPERQRTLRAAVEWSVGLLDDDERSLLETVAVFTDGWTIDAAARVAGLEEDRALELFEALARHSLVPLDLSGDASRCRMLETVRAFVAEGRRRRRRGPTAPRRVQRVANSTARRSPANSPDPPGTGGRAVRTGVRCRVSAQPAGGGGRHQGPAR